MSSHQAPDRRPCLRPGHVYCLMICATLVLVTIIGTFGGR